MDRLLDNFKDHGNLLLRVGIGVFMLTHGVPKLMMLFSGGEIQFPDPIGLGVMVSLVLAVFAEFLCSVLLIIGFKVRLACIPLAITMFVAFFMVHSADPWGKKEKAALYLLSYLAILLMGGGKFSIDAKLKRS